MYIRVEYEPGKRPLIMPKTHVDKSIIVAKNPQEVFSVLSNFHEWTPWSPWLIMEPEATVNVAGDGKYYEWKGELVGSGNMTIRSEKPGEHLAIDLLFLTPWKSKAKVEFTLAAEGEGTRIHWIMDSSLPFFMFWMKKMMEAFIGMDFERGLKMLKDYAETGSVPVQLEFPGVRDFGGCQYVGIKVETTMLSMDESMGEHFARLREFFSGENASLINGAPFSIYHKFQPVSGKVVYTAAVPVTSIPDQLASGMVAGKVPATRIHVVKQTGPYRHIGNIWSAQMSRMRGKRFKKNSSVHPMEVYLNNPSETSENELITEVWMAAR